MFQTLSPQQVGQRIAVLRKLKGLSQADLAQQTNLPRTALTQIEQGNRGIDIFELQRIAHVLNFSLDEFIAPDFNPSAVESPNSQGPAPQIEERISIPTLHIDKFKNVLLYILEKCAGKPNVGETVIYKLLYFVDFNYYELYEEHLTGAKYRKLPFGPVPKKFDAVVQQMINTGHIQRIKTNYHGFMQTRYIPLEKADLQLLKASEMQVIDRVVEQMSDWSAASISNYSHKDIPWLASKEGAEINYELVFYREAPFSVRIYDNEEDA